MWQPRLGISWDPKADGKTVVRANGGHVLRTRPRPDARVVALDQRQPRRRTPSAPASFNGFGVTPPTYPNLLPAEAGQGVPDHPDVFVFDKDFQNPRTWSASASIEREVVPDLAVLVQYNYAKGEHLTRFLERQRPAFGCPWAHRPRRDERHRLRQSGGAGLTCVESTAKSRYNGHHVRPRPSATSHNYQFQVNYTYSKDKSDDDNERDPFTFRYIAKVTNLDAEYGYSDRDQRHRLNALAAVARARRASNVNLRYSYRSAPAALAERRRRAVLAGRFGPASGPHPVRTARSSSATRAARTTSTRRSTCACRASSRSASGVSIEPIFEVFNLFNSKNLLAPADHQPGVQLRRHDHERPRRSAPGAARSAADLVAL